MFIQSLNFRHMQKHLILFLLFIISMNGYAQYKYEREVRVRKSAVPAVALNHVGLMNLDSKIRWFKEQGNQNIYYEAKTKYQGQRYSIKFEEDGSFLDLEIEVTPIEMPERTVKIIEGFLESEYNPYSIEKIQIQFTGNPETVLTRFHEWPSITGIDVNYEIVISTKREGSFVMFELLFSEAGAVVHQAEIISKSIDNLLY